MPFDDVDFIHRPFVADSHWPVKHDEIKPWYQTAANYLLCGSGEFAVPFRSRIGHGLTIETVERWSANPQIVNVHREDLVRSPRIKIGLRTTVTGINLTENQESVASIRVSTLHGARTFLVNNIILAAGGVESTRLLLHFQKNYPRHFGGTDGPLGRYYMGHLSGKIATITFNDPTSIRNFDFKLDGTAYYRRRFLITEETQIANGVLNTVFWPDNPPFYDPAHRSGVLSSVFLALAFPPIGRHILPEAIRIAHTGPRPYRTAAHIRNAVLGAPRGAFDIYSILRDRFARRPRKPGFLVPNSAGKYALHFHAEQIPNPESRIQLSDVVDSYGIPRAAIDLRYSNQDIESVIISHRILDRALRASRIGRIDYWHPPERTLGDLWESAGDGYHQVGCARMGHDPTRSVVDSNLKVHGLSNLYVASSAVFPTTGQANSTLLAVAFAMRLAHWLARSKNSA